MIDPAPSIQDLLQERGYVRRVAGRFARDSADAEDLEQLAWLRMLERPPRHGTGLRGWLSTKLRRLAINHAEAERRRGDREWLVERPLEAPPADLELQRRELARDLEQALERLGAPYAETLRLRYFEDLTPRAIAEVTGVPVETVSTRLKRGQARLRESLDPDYCQRRAWGLALPWTWLRKRRGGGRFEVHGGIGLAAAGTLGLIALSMWMPGAPPLTPERTAVSPPASLAEAQPRIEGHGVRSLRARESDPMGVSALPDEHLSPGPSTAIEAVPIERIQVLALDSDDAVVAGAKVMASAPGRNSGWREVGETNSLGRADVWGIDRHSWVSCEAEGVSPSLARLGFDCDEDGLLRLRLKPATRCEGRVLDERGRPVMGAHVEVLDGFEGRARIRRDGFLVMGRTPAPAETDREGRFRIDGILRREQELRVSATGFDPALARVRIGREDPDEQEPVEVVLRPSPPGEAPDPALLGHVVDVHGEPVPGVRVQARKSTDFASSPFSCFNVPSRARSSWTDQDGAFRIPAGVSVAHDIWFYAPGERADAPFAALVAVDPGEARVVQFEHRPSARVEGTLDHRLPDDSMVLLVSPALFQSRVAHVESGSGRFSIESLPAGEYSLSLWTPGRLWSDVQRVSLTHGEHAGIGLLQGPPQGSLHIQVAREDGASLLGTWVQLDLSERDRFTVRYGASYPGAKFALDGSVVFCSLPLGPHTVRFGGGGQGFISRRMEVLGTASEAHRIVLRTGVVQDVRLVALDGVVGSLTLRLTSADGSLLTTRRIEVSAVSWTDGFSLEPASYTLRVERDGVEIAARSFVVAAQGNSLLEVQLETAASTDSAAAQSE